MEYLVQRSDADEPRFAFRRGITEEVAYASLTQDERYEMHDAVGVALELLYDPSRPDPAYFQQLAHHFSHGLRGRNRRARYMLRSADAAASLFANEAAISQYRETLRLAQSLKDPKQRLAIRVDAQVRLGDLLLRQSRLDEAESTFKAAFDLVASDPERRVRLSARLALIAIRRGDPSRALELLAEARAEGAEPAVRAQAEALASLALSSQGEARPAADAAERAIELGGEALSGEAQFALGVARTLQGDLAAAALTLERGIAASQRIMDVVGQEEGRTQLSLVRCLLGDFPRAIDDLRRAAQAAGHADTSRTRGDLPALERSQAASSRRTPIPAPGVRPPRRRWAGCLERGEGERAQPHLNRALELAERMGAPGACAGRAGPAGPGSSGPG